MGRITLVVAIMAASLLTGCRDKPQNEIGPAAPEWLRSAMAPDEEPKPDPAPAVSAEPAPASQDASPPPAVPEVSPPAGPPSAGESGPPDAVPSIDPQIPWKLFDDTVKLFQPTDPPAVVIDPAPAVEPDSPAEREMEPAPIAETVPEPPPAAVETPVVSAAPEIGPARVVPPPHDIPAPDLRIELDPAFVASQTLVASGPDGTGVRGQVELLCFGARWCVWCNGPAIMDAAREDGLGAFVQYFDIDKDNVTQYRLPQKIPHYMLVRRDEKGGIVVLKRWTSQQSYATLKAALVAALPPEPSTPLTGAFKAGTVQGGADAAKKAIALARKILGDNGSLAITYKKPGVSGFVLIDDFGVPLKINSQLTFGWRCSGDTLTLSIDPPIKARVVPLYWVLLDKITLSLDGDGARADVSVLRGPDVYLQLQ